jgi:hypothetical protein
LLKGHRFKSSINPEWIARPARVRVAGIFDALIIETPNVRARLALSLGYNFHGKQPQLVSIFIEHARLVASLSLVGCFPVKVDFIRVSVGTRPEDGLDGCG